MKSSKSIWSVILLAIPCLLPLGWRLANTGLGEPAGLVSDLAIGLLIFALSWRAPRWLRSIILLFFALGQLMAQELLAAMQRLPSWQDLQYLADPTFVGNTTAGFHLAHPLLATLFLLSTLAAILAPRLRPGWGRVSLVLVIGLALFGGHRPLSRALNDQAVASRFNPLHWFVTDGLASLSGPRGQELTLADLPESLRTLDLSGHKLLGRGRAKNVLIVTLEGMPGIYLKEIREAMRVSQEAYRMRHLEESTRSAMLVPDFVDHSHQTIRGLYALHCGDFSKFSYEMPKAMELLDNPERAAECLPAQMSRQGWQTHYLQGAGLQFMNKERAMPAMGFQEVHGVEWFTERTQTDFIWGTNDADFFRGARKYVASLQAAGKPWLLSLLTVATHQPFAATDEQVRQYGSRKIASVALLDQAVGAFIEGLRQDGVLDDTLVVITSDESHGEDGADWYSSWGFAIVLAPEGDLLPRIKGGTYGLVDLEATILDYFDLAVPPSIIGRSLFRDYDRPREMLSYTSSRLRWHTADGYLFECGVDGNCRKMKTDSLIGPRPETYEADIEHSAARLFALAAVLDHKLTSGKRRQVLEFGGGEVRTLKENQANEWTDNLVGAQYLDFPAGARVAVDIRLRVLTAPEQGVQLHLNLRQFEIEVGSIDHPNFPVLHAGEEGRLGFTFTTQKAMQAFSFHLFGDGQPATVKIDKFEVVIDRQ